MMVILIVEIKTNGKNANGININGNANAKNSNQKTGYKKQL